jgi:hypothetical protein
VLAIVITDENVETADLTHMPGGRSWQMALPKHGQRNEAQLPENRIRVGVRGERYA